MSVAPGLPEHLYAYLDDPEDHVSGPSAEQLRYAAVPAGLPSSVLMAAVRSAHHDVRSRAVDETADVYDDETETAEDHTLRQRPSSVQGRRAGFVAPRLHSPRPPGVPEKMRKRPNRAVAGVKSLISFLLWTAVLLAIAAALILGTLWIWDQEWFSVEYWIDSPAPQEQLDVDEIIEEGA